MRIQDYLFLLAVGLFGGVVLMALVFKIAKTAAIGWYRGKERYFQLRKQERNKDGETRQ
jgi:hypothetical protein